MLKIIDDFHHLTENLYDIYKMKKAFFILNIILYSLFGYSQTRNIIENQATLFSLENKEDTIDFIIVDKNINQEKPIFLWCQGSQPVPLFCEIENYGFCFFGGGINNFSYQDIIKEYHLVVISMPMIPIKAKIENLDNQYNYIPNPKMPNAFSDDFIDGNYLENYVDRANIVLNFLKDKSWVDANKLVIAGHSQGTKVATKIAVTNSDVTHLGLFAANPFGRIDQFIREARLDAQLGKTSWGKADSVMNDNYRFYEQVNNEDSIIVYPSLKAWKTFNETYYDDWLSLDIPIYLTYGTEDQSAALCDIIPLFFIEKQKTNLYLKRHLGLEHNFFEVENGKVNYEKSHWNEVMEGFTNWIK